MNDPAKNILIGLFVIAASAIVIFVILFLHPTVGDDGLILRVRFANIDKISSGTRVTYGGKPVGEVIDVREVENEKDPRKPSKDGYVYLYELQLGVDSKVKVYNTDQIVSRTSGLLGEKSVEITPIAAKSGEKIWIVNDQVLYANETGSVEETLKGFKELANGIEVTMHSVNSALLELKEEDFWKSLGVTAKNLSDITTSLNQPEQYANILNNAEDFTKRINTVAYTVNEAAEHFVQISHNARSGEGTFGRLFMKDDLYLQSTALFNKAETVLDDINHYGLLFQNDKRWQRVRARRVNLITRLSSPCEFLNYFNEELNTINTALSRLSMVIQETESGDCYESFMEDEEFRKVFAELLRRVNTMEESLKLYNQQVVDRDVYKTELICQ